MSQLNNLKESEGAISDKQIFSATNANLPTNIRILQITHFNESRNFTCEAQNSFGLVVFKLSLVMKGF